MAEPPPTARRSAGATVALVAAGLLAAGAVGVKTLGSGGSDSVEPAGNSAAAGDPVASPEEMIAQLRGRLRQDPDNDQGWYHLGLLHRESRQLAEAEQAFRRAMQLRPQNADYVAYLGETLLLLGRGNPPPEAERLFRRALELQPGNPQARYYLATIRDLRGDHRGALDELIGLLREAPADAPWEPQVRQAVLTIAEQNGIDVAARLPAQRPSTSPATAAIPGPTPEQLEAARSIPPGRQDAMARGMVERLAGRLRQNPRDADGWIMLMRSRMMLNEPRAASEALRSGLAAFQADSAVQRRLREAAATLGVPGA
ncbi:TPR domain-containing protein [Allosphingosinicella sp.]|jgi:cytochrome c-type biogenesis protein CcmH|uniref:tetratricopeptide repeat protein n=1 Tax=Allosphingosinicella sp. TaxID=2823234 RepID=UPI002EF53C5F